MNLSEYCIRRPVFTSVFIFLLIIIGLLSYKNLPVRHLPNISKPTISVVTHYNGASPELIEKELTIPLENALSGIGGITSMRSQSVLGKSRIKIDFKLDIDINEAINNIRNRSAGIYRKLPDGADMPQVYRNDDDSNPVAIIGFQDTNRNALEMTDYITRYIQPIIQESEGVAEVSLFGAREYAIKIALNPVKMAAHKVTVANIKQALKQQNVNIPAGQIKSKNRFYTVVAQSKLQEPQQFGELVVAHRKDQSIYLREVASVTVGNNNEDHILRINGKSAVGLSITAESTANPLLVAQQIRNTMAQLQPNYPEGFSASIFFDSTDYVKRSIFEVYKTFIEAILFVAAVVFLFLGSLRAALIPIATIPICLVATFAPMYWFGFELNTLTLLAMVLAIGLVVDDAIVMLENCHRHIKNGLSARQAAITGSKEITFALIAMTVTLAAVYAPMGFVEGFTAKLLQQFGITLAATVLISGVVALTLSPLMCAKLLNTHTNTYTLWMDRYFERLSASYEKSLRRALTHWHLLTLLLLAALGLGIYAFAHSGSELAPIEDQSYIIAPVSAPTNTSTSYVDHYVKQLEAIYKNVPEQSNWLSSVRAGSAFTLLKLTPWEDRNRTQQEIAKSLIPKMQALTGVSAFPKSPNPLSQSGGNNTFGLSLLSNNDYIPMNAAANQFVLALEKSGFFSNVKNNFSMDSEQIDIQINRQLANDLQVNFSDIAELIATMVGGNNPIDYTYNGQSYKVVLQLQQDKRRDIAVLNQLYVQSARGKMIPLSSLIHVTNNIGPEDYPHLNRLRSINISADLRQGVTMSEAIEYTNTIAKSSLPDGMQYEYTGAAQDYLESSNSTTLAFFLALLFIYLVLAAQFESFTDPLIVLLTVPLCLLGAITTLYILGINLSIYSTLGLITLIGLITKHGILITEFANSNRKAGYEGLEAVVLSAQIRLKPILMTTLAMLLGALPLALAQGAGSESRRQLGIVILSGMGFGTIFSLYIVPAAWLLINRKPIKAAVTATNTETLSTQS